MILRRPAENGLLSDHIADAGNMIAGGKWATQGTLEIDDYLQNGIRSKECAKMKS